MSNPIATLSGTITWSDNSPFTGYLLLGIVLPYNADGQWPTVTLAGQMAPQRLPIWTIIPIVGGQFDSSARVFKNSAMSPPNTQYVAYWYDNNLRSIFSGTITGLDLLDLTNTQLAALTNVELAALVNAAGGSTSATPFPINANPYPVSQPVLLVPSISSTIPVPQSSTLGV